MTALAILPLDDGIVIAADGALYDPGNGNLVGLTSKIVLVPEWNCIIAQRGVSLFLNAVRYQLAALGVASFDDATSQIVTAAKEVHGQFFGDEDGYWSLFLAGRSDERAKFEVWSLRSAAFEYRDENGVSKTVAPFTLHPLTGFYCAPNPSAESLAKFGISGTPEFPGNVEQAESFVAKIVAAARTTPDTNGFFNVGGFLQTAMLFRDNIVSSIVHRWPDKIGGKIDPSGDIPPTFAK